MTNPNLSKTRRLAPFPSPMRTTKTCGGIGSGAGELGDVAYDSKSWSAREAYPRRRYAGSAKEFRQARQFQKSDGTHPRSLPLLRLRSLRLEENL